VDDVESEPALLGKVHQNRSFLPEAALIGSEPEKRPYNELRFDLRTKLDAWILDRPLDAWGPAYWGMAHPDGGSSASLTSGGHPETASHKDRGFNAGSRALMLAASPPSGLAHDRASEQTYRSLIVGDG
jgi:hypothetical protein